MSSVGTTADGYFSPTLANISEKVRATESTTPSLPSLSLCLLHIRAYCYSIHTQLNIPYDIAGVTFLAFGNGAPDVFSAIAAYSSGVGDTGMNELLGGAMFVSTVVVGSVAVASAVRVDRWPFIRDVSALLASLLLLLVLAAALDQQDAAQNAPVVLLLLVGYALYVASVLVPECVTRYRSARATASRLAPPGSPSSNSAMVLSAFWLALSPRSAPAATGAKTAAPYVFITRAHAAQLAGKDGAYALASPTKQPAPHFTNTVIHDHFDCDDDTSDALSSPLLSDADRIEHGDATTDSPSTTSNSPMAFTTGAGIIESAYWRHLRWRWRVKRRVRSVFASDASILVKVLSVPHAALVLVRDVTIPLLDDDAWSRPLATLSPITVPLFVLLTAGSLDDCVFPNSRYSTPLWQLALAGGAAAAVAVNCCTHRSHAPTTTGTAFVFLALAFASCVCWIYAVANELMALLIAVGVITHASNSLLGLTILAWGNSVGDLITNVSVARAGFPQMAIAGCFGGPVFNILLGLGVPMTVALARGDALALELDAHAVVSLCFLVVSLAASAVVFQRHGFRCPAWYGRLLILYYALYTVVNVAMALHAYVASSSSWSV